MTPWQRRARRRPRPDRRRAGAPRRGTTMLGETREGIAAELGDVEPDWTASVRVAREDGRIVGAVVGDWDAEIGRAWILGPGSPATTRPGAGGPGRWWTPSWSSCPRASTTGSWPPTSLTPGWPSSAPNSGVAQRGQPRLLRGRRHRRHVAGALRRGRPGHPRGPRDDPTLARPGVPGVVRHGRAPGSRPARRQVPCRHRHGRAASPRVRRRPGPADGEGYLDFIAVADAARGRGTGRDLMARLPPGYRGLHDRQAAPHRAGPPNPRPPHL